MHRENILYSKMEVKNCEPQIMQDFYDHLPPKPYCTDTLGILNIRPKAIAAKNAYIQYNPIHRAYILCFDLDYPHNFNFLWWDNKAKIPRPNMEIENRKNQHSHLLYLIDPAVYTLRNARMKPLQLAADIDKGLTTLLSADQSYGKLICKNPLSHDIWNIYIYHDHKYTLKELIEFIPDKIKNQKQKPKQEIGLGRNCTVFEKARHFAYSEWRKLKFNDAAQLFENVLKYAMKINYDFIIPMTNPEVKCIARSVSRWTAKHLDSVGFSNWCSIRGKVGNRKSQIVRAVKSQTRAEQIVAYKTEYPDMSNRAIAKVLGIPETTVRRLLKL